MCTMLAQRREPNDHAGVPVDLSRLETVVAEGIYLGGMFTIAACVAAERARAQPVPALSIKK